MLNKTHKKTAKNKFKPKNIESDTYFDKKDQRMPASSKFKMENYMSRIIKVKLRE
jgi:hypothetical protein